jgi:predicted metalloprotease with PDZ domain
VDAYADGAKKIVHEAGAVYGEFPKFDFGTYTFVACYRSDCGGDGMEHRNSTSVSGGSMAGDGTRGLGTLAHEYFHSWNVKRIRPIGLEPFDYDRANMTDGLWIAEGFTQYYGPLLEARAGVVPAANVIRGLGGTINNVANSPGRLFYGPIGMSRQAPFFDGAAANDPISPNIFISYYTYGAAIASALDFSLRARGKSLDDFMRTMWLNHGKPEIPYSMHDARHALITTSGDSAWAVDFWTRFVEGHELPDYAPLLERAGILLRKSNAGQPWVGGFFGAAGGGRGGRGGGNAGATTDVPARVAGAPAGTPLYAAGLDAGDVINTVDGKPITTSAEFAAEVAAHKPGDRITVAYTGLAGPARNSWRSATTGWHRKPSDPATAPDRRVCRRTVHRESGRRRAARRCAARGMDAACRDGNEPGGDRLPAAAGGRLLVALVHAEQGSRSLRSRHARQRTLSLGRAAPRDSRHGEISHP